MRGRSIRRSSTSSSTAAKCRSTASTPNSTSGTWRGSRTMSDIRRPMTEIRDRGRGRDRVVACSLLALAATVAYPNVSARQMPSAPAYAITGAKIVTGTSTIDKGTIVMRNGIIEDVDANVDVPADAVVVDGANMTVYPGLIDMTNTTAVETPR